MDVDVETLHVMLLDAALPSSIHDLKNPTEGYVVKLLKSFLSRFFIDSNSVDKPFLEQQNIMVYSEDSNIMGLINLYLAMLQISVQIFIRDLCITDITSPGQKKLRRHAKFLGNFILYVNNKTSELKDRIHKSRGKGRLWQDLQLAIDETKTEINNKALHSANQMSIIEMHQIKIEKIKAKIEADYKKLHEIRNQKNMIQEIRKKAVAQHEIYKEEQSKLSKVISELQEEIVTSPEEYHLRLKQLEEEPQKKAQAQKIKQEAIQEKKQLIEQQENTLNFVEKQLSELPLTNELYKQSKKIAAKNDDLRKQIDVLGARLIECEREVAAKREQCNTMEPNEIHMQCEELLSPLRKARAEKVNQQKLLRIKVETEKVRCGETYLEKNNTEIVIKTVEEQLTNLLKYYQELYNNEIAAQLKLRDTCLGN